jgi:hypothetical protein
VIRRPAIINSFFMSFLLSALAPVGAITNLTFPPAISCLAGEHSIFKTLANRESNTCPDVA